MHTSSPVAALGLTLAMLALLGAGTAAQSAADGWRPLFNGKDLTGFMTSGTAMWRVEDGVIVGGQDGDPSRRGHLVTIDEFKDFELELDFLIDEHGTYNSGVQIRGSAYQINIGRPAAGEFIGVGIHRGEPRQFVWLSKGDEEDTVRKPLEWNTLRIRAVGAHFQVTLNGVKTVDVTDPEPDPRWLERGPLAVSDLRRRGPRGLCQVPEHADSRAVTAAHARAPRGWLHTDRCESIRRCPAHVWSRFSSALARRNDGRSRRCR